MEKWPTEAKAHPKPGPLPGESSHAKLFSKNQSWNVKVPFQISKSKKPFQISKYSSLWLYTIHSRNAELIQLLEDFKVGPPNDNYENCFCESIKCHHNENTD